MGLDPPKCFQPREFMVRCQTFGRNHQTRAGFLAAMPRLLLPHSRVVHPGRAKAGPCVGEKGILVGFQRQAAVASTVHDRCNRAAITVRAASAVTILPLIAIRPSTLSPASSS